jgi:hypothetical protein
LTETKQIRSLLLLFLTAYFAIVYRLANADVYPKFKADQEAKYTQKLTNQSIDLTALFLSPSAGIALSHH